MTPDSSDRNDEIWALAQAGMAHSAIAEKFGISRARVGQIIASRTPVEWGFTDQHRAAVRHQETEVLKRLAKAAERVVDSRGRVGAGQGRRADHPRTAGRPR